GPLARTHAGGPPPNITFDVLEPLEGDYVVFQQLAPAKIGGPKQGRISVLLRINNNNSVPIKVNKIELLGQAVTTPASLFVVPAYASARYQNFVSDTSMPLIINEPFPNSIKIAVFVVGFDLPLEKVMPLAPHTNDGGPLFYPGKASDLRQNEVWGASSNHGS